MKAKRKDTKLKATKRPWWDEVGEENRLKLEVGTTFGWGLGRPRPQSHAIKVK